ncbi:hypothetical protein WISP_04174 [Willisornis vidua]|uniref:Uncharacterized protein n=1 Tax=Willisornis vidua TaxID=1566151 RepID=A0ABQ9DTF9_9PASS|nr:hypothetical protein WISP_04174 [Willisornis vidua]
MAVTKPEFRRDSDQVEKEEVAKGLRTSNKRGERNSPGPRQAEKFAPRFDFYPYTDPGDFCTSLLIISLVHFPGNRVTLKETTAIESDTVFSRKYAVNPWKVVRSNVSQPVQVSLQNLPTLQQINTPTQPGVHCKLAESAFNPLVQVGHLVMEGDQAGEAGPAFHQPMLAEPDPLVVLYMLCDCTQDDLLRNTLSSTKVKLTSL